MGQNKSEYFSSQKSPKVTCIQLKKYRDKIQRYRNMFLDDFCQWFSIDLRQDRSNRTQNFYDIAPLEDTLKDLLLFKNPQFLEYALDKLLAEIMQDMICYGKAYLEIVTWRDKKGNVHGISLVLIKPIIAFRGKNRTIFLVRQYDKKIKVFCIENHNIILFKMKNLGISHNHIRRILKKIDKHNILNIINTTLNSRKNGFDFDEYVHMSEYELLKETRDIYWYGRNGSNSYMSESYLLYRAAKFKTLRRNALKYLLQKINEGLEKHKYEVGFDGKLVANCENIDYEKEFKKLWRGEINISELSALVFRI